MAELFKNIYNEKFFDKFVKLVQEAILGFDKESFLNDIYDNEWKNQELKQRIKHIALTFKKYLSEDYETNVKTILFLIPTLEKNGFKPNNFEFIFLPDFIEVYGIDNLAPNKFGVLF